MLKKNDEEIIGCSQREFQLLQELMDNPNTFDNKYDSLKDSQILAESITPEEFITNPYYLGKGAENLWDRNKEIFIEVASNKKIEIIVLTGSIGWGKGYLGSVFYAWYLFEFLRHKIPQALCGLSRNSAMYGTITSKSATHAKKSFYKEIRGMLRLSPFFSEKRPFDNHLKSELLFRNDNHGEISIMPSAPDAIADIGLNLFLCLLDEISFMDIITDSKRAEPGKKTYDQAQRLFENLRKRIRNRTDLYGQVMGKLILTSSANYEGDAIDQIIKKRKDDPTIVIIEEEEINTRPGARNQPSFFCFLGDIEKKIPPVMFNDPEEIKNYPEDLVRQVMGKYKTDFEDNIYGAIRDVLGIRTSISSHLFPDKSVVDRIFVGQKEIFPKVTKLDNIPELVKKIIPYLNLDYNYAIHFDLSKNKCFAGMVLSRVTGLIEENESKEFNDELANRALISCDFLISIDKDDLLGEVSIPATEELVFELINKGVQISSASWDGFQSQGSRQRFESIIRNCDILAIDRDKDIYYNILRIMNHGRLKCSFHKTVELELKSLLDLPGSKKITKGQCGSKDLSDALASSVWQLCEYIKDFTSNSFTEFDFYEANSYNGSSGKKSDEIHGNRIANDKPW